jgi:hypothetical protein
LPHKYPRTPYRVVKQVGNEHLMKNSMNFLFLKYCLFDSALKFNIKHTLCGGGLGVNDYSNLLVNFFEIVNHARVLNS